MTRSPHPGEAAILEVGISYIDEIFPYLNHEIKIPLIQTMGNFLNNSAPYEQARQVFISMIGRSEPLDRLKEILDIPNEPLTNSEPESDDSPTSSRKKTRPWTALEDSRLLSGIYHFGIDNWTTISHFIGNGRTRAQCCQRWTRGLNPRISKEVWSTEEDTKLIRLVAAYGDKSWTKIASLMGNRSDVQCRYHYHQVIRDKAPNPASTSPWGHARPNTIAGGNSLPMIIPPRNQAPMQDSSQADPIAMRPTLSQPVFAPRPIRNSPPPPPIPRRTAKPSQIPVPDDRRMRFLSPEQMEGLAQRRPRSHSNSFSLDGFLKHFE